MRLAASGSWAATALTGTEPREISTTCGDTSRKKSMISKKRAVRNAQIHGRCGPFSLFVAQATASHFKRKYVAGMSSLREFWSAPQNIG
jgi:hypothetical protein